MANYTHFYDWVVPTVPAAPLTLVQFAIRDAVIDLCSKALIYRQELQQILVLAPTSTTLTAAAASGATSVTVASITDLADDDTITIELADTTKWRGHISGTPVALTVTLDGALPSAADSGATLTKLVYLYPITLPANTSFVKGLQAWLNDAPLDPISQDDLDNEFNNTSFGWVGVNWRTDVNLPTRFYFPDDTTVGLVMPPDSQGVLRINAALKPSHQSTTFPDWIADRYDSAIAIGAKAKLLMEPKKPWSDLKLGAYYQRQFDDEIGEARVITARGATRAPLRTHTVYGLR
jgi:hypothetical protein